VKGKRAAQLVTIAALLAGILAGTSYAVAHPDTDPVVDQGMQQKSRDAANSVSRFGPQGFEADFVSVAIPAAQAVMDGYRVPASVGMAQSILESNWGRSTLSVNDKNYFGFKCTTTGDPGPIATGCHAYDTTECTPDCHPAVAFFRVYTSMADSFRDYGRHLSTSSLYAPAFQFLNDPDQFAREIARHYATDPEYANKVIDRMVTWNLYQFNNRARGPSLSGDARAEVIGVRANGEAHSWFNAVGFATMPWGGSDVMVANGIADPTRIRWADLDGDGKTDFIAVNPATGEVRAWHNFAGFATMPWGGASVVIATGITDPSRLRFADLDGDRRAEVINIEAGGNVRAWHNATGFATMPWGGASVVIGSGFGPDTTYLADLDADGKADIMSGFPDGSLHAWRNFLGFAPSPWGGANMVIATGTTGPTTKVGDLDGDGRADVMTVEATTGEVQARHNIGYAFVPWVDNTVVATGITDPRTVFFA
jgi:flagellum-specific peptidoglycan hydrolase FlgJ